MKTPAWAGAQVALKGAWFAAIGAVVVGSLGFAAVQTVRLNGLHLWPISIEGWIATAGKREAERDQERSAHIETKARIASAAKEAERLEQQRIERVKSEQKEISDAIEADYRTRLADARARAGELRRQLQAGGTDSGAGGGGEVHGVSVATGRAAAAAEDPGLPDTAIARAEQLERDLVATEQAIQLNALIDWVVKQAGIDPNQSDRDQPSQ